MKKNIKEVVELCGVNTVEEVTELLEKVANKGHMKVAALLNEKPDWTKWNPFVIKQIPTAVKYVPVLTTKIFYPKNPTYTYEGEEFVDFDKNLVDLNDYMVRTEETAKERKIYFDEIIRQTPYEKALEKLNNNENLSQSEIVSFMCGAVKVEDTVIDLNRWTASMETIVSAEDKYYRISYEKGLTEMQCDEDWYEQPQLVVAKTELVEVTTWKDV